MEVDRQVIVAGRQFQASEIGFDRGIEQAKDFVFEIFVAQALLGQVHQVDGAHGPGMDYLVELLDRI
ncbi:hypothetical protein D3C71_1885940 [compost metagenome]